MIKKTKIKNKEKKGGIAWNILQLALGRMPMCIQNPESTKKIVQAKERGVLLL